MNNFQQYMEGQDKKMIKRTHLQGDQKFRTPLRGGDKVSYGKTEYSIFKYNLFEYYLENFKNFQGD